MTEAQAFLRVQAFVRRDEPEEAPIFVCCDWASVHDVVRQRAAPPIP